MKTSVKLGLALAASLAVYFLLSRTGSFVLTQMWLGDESYHERIKHLEERREYLLDENNYVGSSLERVSYVMTIDEELGRTVRATRAVWIHDHFLEASSATYLIPLLAFVLTLAALSIRYADKRYGTVIDMFRKALILGILTYFVASIVGYASLESSWRNEADDFRSALRTSSVLGMGDSIYTRDGMVLGDATFIEKFLWLSEKTAVVRTNLRLIPTASALLVAVGFLFVCRKTFRRALRRGAASNPED